MQLKVTPELTLEATMNGNDLTCYCYVMLSGQSYGDKDHSNDDNNNVGDSPTKQVT